MLVHVNHCLILWYLCIAFMIIGVRVDSHQDGETTAGDIAGLTAIIAILAAWLVATYFLHRWAARPPSPRARLKDWRRDLTALANGFIPSPSSAATFSSIITPRSRGVREYPRFVAPGVEFGTLTHHRARSVTWHYIAVALPAPLPHLILDASSNNRRGSDLPVDVARSQRLSLEGDFDRWFHVYSPTAYGADALYVLTPDVMAALIDEASGYNVEIVDDALVFFSPTIVDFGSPAHWEAVDSVLTRVAPRILAKAFQYVDERVPGQEVPRALTALLAAREEPDVRWTPPTPRIGTDGRRLDVRDPNEGIAPVLGAIGWFALLAFLYAVPGIFAFAGFMSVIDGR
ncbi:hypothetical protein F6B41_04585 [Microbacterium lushaniae]|nr:hypothetical protein F6B41_25655 [Microbacterium lushaniae]KAA9157818.1 hypothetical protein F6B41_04585 [Microbacterium lushaniae]